MQRVVSSLGGRHAVHFVHIYVHLIPIDVGSNCWSNTTTASEPPICLQCPSGKHRGIERQNDFTSQVHLVCIRSPRTNHAGGLGCFHLGITMKVLCIFFPLGGKMMALLSRGIPSSLFMEPEESDIQGGQHAAFCFLARVRVWQRERAGGRQDGLVQ